MGGADRPGDAALLSAVASLLLTLALFQAVVAAEDTSTIAHLWELVGFDQDLGMVTRPTTQEGWKQLEGQGLSSPSAEVRRTSLAMIALMLEQQAIPPEVSSRVIADAVSRATAPTAATPAPPGDLGTYAARVVWNLRVRDAGNSAARASYLARSLEGQGDDAGYRAHAAIDYLAELGEDGARELRAFTAREAVRRLDPEVLARAKLALRKIELAARVPSLPHADAVALLLGYVRAPETHRMESESKRWAIGELARLRPQADGSLRALASDSTLDDDVRMAAAFALTQGATAVRWRW